MRDFIVNFLEAKKEDFLQAKINSKLSKKKEVTDEDRLKVRAENQFEADEKYNLDTWLENIIRKIKPNVTTHPAKFTNAKIDKDTAQIFLGHFRNDGYLRTGNVHLKNKVDVSGNSATNTIVFELYELLDSVVEADQKLIHKFESNDESLKKLIHQLNGDFDYVQEKCLKVYYGEKSVNQTHGSIRQVYFPIQQDQYHLLSVKTASMLMYELKNRIDDMDVWIDKQHARTFKKDNKFLEGGFSEIFGITEIGFSHGDFLKMGNYSYLNVRNKGISYLLSSSPPTFEERKVKLPTFDFFEQCLYSMAFKQYFEELQVLIRKDLDGATGKRKNTFLIRNDINKTLRKIIEQILFKAFCIRKYKKEWSKGDSYKKLPLYQRIWLDDFYEEQREIEEGWFEDVSHRISKWIIDVYVDKEIVENSYMLGSGEILAVKEIVKELLEEDKEFF